MAAPKRKRSRSSQAGGRPQKRQPQGCKSQEDEVSRQGAKPSPIEWTVGAVSLLLVISMIGFVFYQGIIQTPSEAMLRVVSGPVEPIEGGFRVRFRAVNDGDRTASGVTVEGELRRDGRSFEASNVQIDYVPGHSEHQGALQFTQDPRGSELRLRATGYRHP